MKIHGINGIVSILPQKGFGYSQDFGTAFFGFCLFANFNQWAGIYARKRVDRAISNAYGWALFGLTEFGSTTMLYHDLSYRTRAKKYGVTRKIFYWPAYTRNEKQDEIRTTFASAVLFWQGLTDSQKLVYDNRARARRMSGYNLFISQMMKSS